MTTDAVRIATEMAERDHRLCVSDIRLIYQRMGEAYGLTELLEELREYMDQRADCDNGVPNKAMQLQQEVEKQLARLGK